MVANPPQMIQTLIVSSREEQAERLADAVRRGRETNYLGLAQKADEALRAVAEAWPDVIVIDDPVFGATTPGLVQELLKVNPSAVIVVLAAPDALNIVQRAMTSGARGFLLRPIDPAELVANICQLYDLEHARSAADASAGAVRHLKRGQIIAVAGLKGGIGRTMIAANLALALRRQGGAQKSSVILLDAHLEKGDCAAHLNLHPAFTIADLFSRFNEVDHELIEQVLTRHNSGLKLLAAPASSNAIIQAPAYQMETILNGLQDTADSVVVDLGPTLTEINLMVMDMADILLIVTVPEIPALLHTRALLEMSKEHDYSPDKVNLLLNRADMRGGVPTSEIEDHLKIHLLSQLPDDGPLVSYSINQGAPLVLSAERSEIARGITSLAAGLAAASPIDGPKPGRKTGFSNVFDRLGSALQRKDQPAEAIALSRPWAAPARGAA